VIGADQFGERFRIALENRLDDLKVFDAGGFLSLKEYNKKPPLALPDKEVEEAARGVNRG
jgi:hypothetical protein